jgi:serine phosphatase RsbU (regulator of sigma subunit)
MNRLLVAFLTLLLALPAHAQAWDDRLDKAMRVIAENRRDPRHADALNEAAELVMAREPDKALEYADKAARLASLLSYDLAEARALGNLGYLEATKKGKAETAIKSFADAAALYHQLLGQNKVAKGVVYEFITLRLIPATRMLEEQERSGEISRRGKKVLKEYKSLQGEFAGLIAEIARSKETESRTKDTKLDSATVVLANKKNELMVKELEIRRREAELQNKNKQLTVGNREKQLLSRLNAELSDGLTRSSDSLQHVLDSLEATATHLQITTETLLLHEMRLQQEALTNAQEKAKNEQLEEAQTRQRWLLAAGGGVLVLVLGFLFVLWRQARIRQRLLTELGSKNQELEHKNHEISQQKEEIESRNEDILLQKEEIEAQRDDILAKNSQITASIQYAQRIQAAILPDPAKLLLLVPESFILFMPRDVVSGDFYWFAEVGDLRRPGFGDRIIETPNWESPVLGWGAAGARRRNLPSEADNLPLVSSKVIIAAMDCTGHGVPGAFMSMIGNRILEDVVHVRGITSPDQILAELHQGVMTSLRQRDTNNRDGMDATICVIDRQAGIMEFAGAMNPLIYIQNDELFEIKGDKKTIGGYNAGDERTFTKHLIDISRPGAYYMFSDGIADQFGGPEKRKFMHKNLRNKLVAISHLPMPEQQRQLEKTIDHWRYGHGYNKQTDDMLLIGFRV